MEMEEADHHKKLAQSGSNAREEIADKVETGAGDGISLSSAQRIPPEVITLLMSVNIKCECPLIKHL